MTDAEVEADMEVPLVEGDPFSDITIRQDRARLRMIMKDGALRQNVEGTRT